MAEGLLLAKDAGEELFKVVGLLVFALIAGVFQWLKARGEKRARQVDVGDDESDAPVRPAARPVAMPGPVAPGPVPPRVEGGTAGAGRAGPPSGTVPSEKSRPATGPRRDPFAAARPSTG
jgi:hypothetical protein